MTTLPKTLGEVVAAKKKAKKKPSTKLRDNALFFIKYSLGKKGIEVATEYKFHPDRKWRFDMVLVDYRIAIEYEGIRSAKSRHTTPTGYTGDCEKYNAAIVQGWKVLRYTALNIKNALNDIEKLINTTK